jgi:hypothetical protein
MNIEEALETFKASVVQIRFESDTLALDKALGEAEELLHAVRQTIDDEWRAARATRRPSRRATDAVEFALGSLGITEEELAEALTAVRGRSQK